MGKIINLRDDSDKTVKTIDELREHLLAGRVVASAIIYKRRFTPEEISAGADKDGVRDQESNGIIVRHWYSDVDSSYVLGLVAHMANAISDYIDEGAEIAIDDKD